MNIGRSIRCIREEHNMSQEEFAQIFFVTRQTVSNWENERSFPDLSTIVKISDTFAVSLDKLLKEDREMVNKISDECEKGKRWSKIRRTVFLIISVLIILMLTAFAVYGAVWHSRKKLLEGRFNGYVKELGFAETGERYYVLDTPEGAAYKLSHQEMPPLWDFCTDFHAKFIYGSFETEDSVMTVTISGGEMCSLKITDKSGAEEDVYLSLSADGGLRNADRQDKLILMRYQENSDMIRRIVQEGTEIYNKVYA